MISHGIFCAGPKAQYAACQNEMRLDFGLSVMEHSQKGFEPWIFEDRADLGSLEEIQTNVAQLGPRSHSYGVEYSQAT